MDGGPAQGRPRDGGGAVRRGPDRRPVGRWLHGRLPDFVGDGTGARADGRRWHEPRLPAGRPSGCARSSSRPARPSTATGCHSVGRRTHRSSPNRASMSRPAAPPSRQDRSTSRASPGRRIAASPAWTSGSTTVRGSARRSVGPSPPPPGSNGWFHGRRPPAGTPSRSGRPMGPGRSRPRSRPTLLRTGRVATIGSS